MTRARAVRLAPIALLAAAGLAGLILLPDAVGIEWLREHRAALVARRDADPLLAAGIYAGVLATVVALSLPGAFVMTVAGGFLFGLLAGTLLATTAASAGAGVVFLAVRAGFGGRRHDPQVPLPARLRAWLGRDPVGCLLLLRMVPVVPFPVANVAPALLGVPFRLYLLTTFFGILPGTLLTAWIGAAADGLVGTGAPAIPVGPGLAIAALALIALAVRALWRRAGDRRAVRGRLVSKRRNA